MFVLFVLELEFGKLFLFFYFYFYFYFYLSVGIVGLELVLWLRICKSDELYLDLGISLIDFNWDCDFITDVLNVVFCNYGNSQNCLYLSIT